MNESVHSYDTRAVFNLPTDYSRGNYVEISLQYREHKNGIILPIGLMNFKSFRLCLKSLFICNIKPTALRIISYASMHGEGRGESKRSLRCSAFRSFQFLRCFGYLDFVVHKT